MHFDDEKDNVENIEDLQIPQDEAISWDTIIDTDEDGIVSIKDGSTVAPDEVPVEVFTNEGEAIPDINSIDLGDDLSVVQDEDEVLDEAELAKILNSDEPEEQQLEYSDTTDTENFETDVQEEAPIEGVDTQEAEDDIVPRKETIENKKSVSPVLIALLVALIVLAGSYFAFTMFSNNEEDDVPLVNTDALQQNTENEVQNTENLPQEGDAVNNADTNIPVVNEEEVDSLKADEKEEKKQVVNVIPTGRTNPFMPINKYKPSTATINTRYINTIDYSHLNIPKAPMQIGKDELSGAINKLMSVSVSGIMYDAQKPSAIITYNGNDYFVLVGDKLDKFKVVSISPENVKIAYGKNIYSAKVGESFEIRKDFYGNIKYTDSGRQYYSSEDEYYSITGDTPDSWVKSKSNTNSQKGQRQGGQNQGGHNQGGYTSDNDIMIRNR